MKRVLVLLLIPSAGPVVVMAVSLFASAAARLYLGRRHLRLTRLLVAEWAEDIAT